MKKYNYTLIDEKGCKNIAFYLAKMPERTVLNPREVIYPDGKLPKVGERLRCASCKRFLFGSDGDLDIAFIRRKRKE